MSSLDESLFGRIAVFNNYLRQDHLDECLSVQRALSPPRPIGDLLLEKGYITREQLRTILEIRRKKLRKMQRKPEEARETNRAFGDFALGSGRISIDDLEEAVLEQQRLASMNLHFCLGEVLVARGKMSASDVLDILSQQGKCILLCPVCDAHYNVVKFRSGKTYRCVHCGTDLIKPKFLDTIAVDGVIEE